MRAIFPESARVCFSAARSPEKLSVLFTGSVDDDRGQNWGEKGSSALQPTTPTRHSLKVHHAQVDERHPLSHSLPHSDGHSSRTPCNSCMSSSLKPPTLRYSQPAPHLKISPCSQTTRVLLMPRKLARCYKTLNF